MFFLSANAAFYSCHLLNPPIRLFVRDHLFDALDIGDIRVGRASQATAALGVLLGEDVALESLGALDLAGLGEIESLLRATVRFQFGHCIFSFLGLLTSYYWCSAASATGT